VFLSSSVVLMKTEPEIAIDIYSNEWYNRTVSRLTSKRLNTDEP
jgi:hypothetical protein